VGKVAIYSCEAASESVSRREYRQSMSIVQSGVGSCLTPGDRFPGGLRLKVGAGWSRLEARLLQKDREGCEWVLYCVAWPLWLNSEHWHSLTEQRGWENSRSVTNSNFRSLDLSLGLLSSY
jgi:hypothetical protein